MSRIALGLVLMSALTSHGAEPFLNLGFEAVRGTQPRVWSTYGNGYGMAIDDFDAHTGKSSLRIECRGVCVGEGRAHQAFGGTCSFCLQTFPLEIFRGKHIRYSGYIKTLGVKSGDAGLYWGVYGSDGPLTVDRMEQTAPRGTTSWTRYVIEREIDPRATLIDFGVRLNGNSTVWFDSLEIEIDGKPYPQPPPPAPPEPAAREIEWVRRNAIPLSTDQPGHGFKDLQPLKRVIGDARIVGLGEQTHGTGEFQRMKHRLVEFLASEMGFTILAFENGMAETYHVNQYLLNGVGDPKQVVEDMHTWDWYTQEVVDMVTWMRQFNQSGKGRVEFWGVDMQNPRSAAANVRRFLGATDPELAGKAYKTLQAAFQPGASQATKEAAIQEAAELLDSMRARRPALAKGRKLSDVDWAIQNARVVVQGLSDRWGKDRGKVRDRAMAENVAWLMEQRPGAKIILWAHNNHVKKKPGLQGGYLADRYGSAYRSLGFAFHEGWFNAVSGGPASGAVAGSLGPRDAAESYPGSFEYVLHRSGIPRFVLDLRAPAAESNAWLRKPLDWRGNIGAIALDGFEPNSRLTSEFDALVFFDRTTPTHLLPFCWQCPPPTQ